MTVLSSKKICTDFVLTTVFACRERSKIMQTCTVVHIMFHDLQDFAVRFTLRCIFHFNPEFSIVAHAYIIHTFYLTYSDCTVLKKHGQLTFLFYFHSGSSQLPSFGPVCIILTFFTLVIFIPDGTFRRYCIPHSCVLDVFVILAELRSQKSFVF
jgi:hypothetical protein